MGRGAFCPRKGGALSSTLDLNSLKQLLASQLCDPDQLKRPEGVETGLKALDQYLLWSGLPKGALSLFRGSLGTGATSLWIETASRIVSQNKWVAWINGEVPLAPHSLFHRSMNLEKFVSVEKPENPEKLFWLLQELMSSSLFEVIGCDLGSLRLKEHQLRKLQTQARDAHVALVFLSQLKSFSGPAAAVFSLILHFEKKQILVERASHKPVPHGLPRSVTYARFTLHIDSPSAQASGDQNGDQLHSNQTHGEKQLSHSRSQA